MCFGQELRMYLVWDAEGISEEEDTIIEQLFQSVDADSDSEDADKKPKKDGKKKKRRSSSSRSQSGAKSEPASSSSEAVCISTVRGW